jgi:lipoprotein-anchoring transpeptidase ErfK/SrfK
VLLTGLIVAGVGVLLVLALQKLGVRRKVAYVAPGVGANWRPRWWPSWLPAGSGRAAVLVSVGRNRAYVHDGHRLWTHFPVATGKDFATPRGSFRVVNKTLSPAWNYKEKHVPGGTYANPLGVAWLGLSMPAGWGRYPIGLHGTNAPWSIGYRVSRGCVRMRNADLITLFEQLAEGDRVFIYD